MSRRGITQNEKVLLALFLGALGFLGFRLWVQPALKRIQENQAKVDGVHKVIGELGFTEDEIRNGKALEKIEQEGVELANRLPKEIEYHQLVEDFLTNPGKEMDIEVLQFEPQGAVKGKLKKDKEGNPIFQPVRIPLKINFLANYVNSVRYLLRLENLNRVLSANRFRMEVDKGDPQKLNVEVTYQLFLAPEEFQGLSKGETMGEGIFNPVSDRFVEVREISFLPKRTIREIEPSFAPLQIDGVIGDRLIIGGDLYGKGDTVEGLKLVQIDFEKGEAIFEQGLEQIVLRFKP